MTRISCLLTLLTLAAGVSATSVNGSLETIGDISVLNLWGTWEEMGRAHGYLLGPDIRTVFENYFFELAGGVGPYNSARQFVQSNFDIPQEFEDYADGLIAGMADTMSLYSDKLGRDMDQLDIFVVSCTPDIAALKGFKSFACSSVSAWDDATADDPVLLGSPAVSRNLDFYVDDTGAILDGALLTTYDPDDGQEFVTIGFCGYMGCLSGMNASGASASINMGNQQGTVQYSPAFVPVTMALSLGLSDPDFDGSGSFDLEDVKNALTEGNMANSYDFHIVGDRDLAGQDSCAVVAELCNRYGYAFRYTWDEPSIAPSCMILTNHHRVLIPPISCSRYTLLRNSLVADPDVTVDRLWTFMQMVGYPATPGYAGTLQTIVFMPEQREMGLGFATVSTPSYQQDPEWIAWSDIFPNHVGEGIEDTPAPAPVLTVSPNPTTGAVTILATTPLQSLAVYDLTGRRLDLPLTPTPESGYSANFSGLPSGIYRVVATSEGMSATEELVLLK